VFPSVRSRKRSRKRLELVPHDFRKELKTNQSQTYPGRIIVGTQIRVAYFLLDRGATLAEISKHAFRDARETKQKQ
jgi:hypothetical protein